MLAARGTVTSTTSPADTWVSRRGGAARLCPGGGRGGLAWSNVADQRRHRRRVRGDLLRANVDAGSTHQYLQVFALLGQHHGDHVTCVAGPCGSPGTVEISLVLSRGIHMHDELDLVDVHPACGNVSGDQYPRRAGHERRKVAVARGLRKVAVQID